VQEYLFGWLVGTWYWYVIVIVPNELVIFIRKKGKE
jgi:hypothetical protein